MNMRQNGNDAAVTRLLAEARQLYLSGSASQAMAIYARIMAFAPDCMDPYVHSGGICHSEGRYEEALYWFQRALGVAADFPPALGGAAHALIALGRPGEALTLFEKLQQREPNSAAAARGAGLALNAIGRLAEARAAFEQAVALAPDDARNHHALALAGRFVDGDPRLAGLEKLAAKLAALPEPQQCELHFAIAKARDDRGLHREAFEHWRAANAIRRKHLDYDEEMSLGLLRALQAAFTPDVMAHYEGAGDPSTQPVFVVGMPRSGTTLVEQVIASHPDAFGAGETMYLHRLLGTGLLGGDFPLDFSAVPAQALRQFGGLYAARLRADAPGALRVVDKLPANFMLCGLIHLVLPQARIIHVRREPLDTCLSCYANLFTQALDYSYDLGELGRYYRRYAALMAHWRRLLPSGAMLEVDYENLVIDFEPQARRIIDYCGLSWNERCLSFHRTDRIVHTLSSAQVRQPLYRSAIGRSAPYRPWLAPLAEALGDAT